MNEQEIPPPTSPLTLKANSMVMDIVMDWFKAKYLPAFKVVMTSGTRTAEKNAQVGGAKNSAHVHGLARDFVLYRPDGTKLAEKEGKMIFDEFILPNWPGFALWEGDHVHVNLPRHVSSVVGAATIGLAAWAGYKALKSLGGKNG